MISCPGKPKSVIYVSIRMETRIFISLAGNLQIEGPPFTLLYWQNLIISEFFRMYECYDSKFLSFMQYANGGKIKMSKQLISGITVMERWNMDEHELYFQIVQGLPAIFRENDEFKEIRGDMLGSIPRDVPEFLFDPDDILKYEQENDWITSGQDYSAMVEEEAQGTGFLITDKANNENDISKAVKLGFNCGKLKHQITKNQFKDMIIKTNRGLTDSLVNKIWNSLPSSIKKEMN